MTPESNSFLSKRANDDANSSAEQKDLAEKEQFLISAEQEQQIELMDNEKISETESKATSCTRRNSFYALRMCFIFICLLDAIHWAYMLRDDSDVSPNVWKFYGKMGNHEHYYLVFRIFLDAIVGFLGMGATFWTKKSAFALPCAFVQPLLIFSRVFAWSFRNRLPEGSRPEDVSYVVFEFLFPVMWFLLSVLTMTSLAQRNKDKQHQFRPQPPMIVVSGSRNGNEESFQFELSP